MATGLLKEPRELRNIGVEPPAIVLDSIGTPYEIPRSAGLLDC
jgi:hypothetical protein